MFSTSRPEAEPVSSDSATLTSETSRLVNNSSRSARSLDRSGKSVQLGDDDHLDSSGADQRQNSGHTGPVRVFSGFTGVDHNVDQFGAMNRGHSANLLLLRLKGTAVICLLIRRNSRVADCLHKTIKTRETLPKEVSQCTR